MQPVLSVVIPARNGGEHLRRTIQCLLAQDTLGRPWEVVIADDCSDVPVAEEFADLLGGDGNPIRVVRREGEGRRSAARNAANRAASGEILLMMDADLDFDSDLVSRHMDHHERGTADVIMGPTCDTWRKEPTRFQKWSDSRSMGGRPAGPFPWRYFKTGNISVRRKLVEIAGGFDESIAVYGGEDTELGYLIARQGGSFHWDPHIEARHLGEIELRRHVRRMIVYGRTGLRYILRKHPDLEFLLGNQWVGPPFARPARPSYIFMRCASPILLWGPIYRAVLRWMERFGFPRLLFTYLSVGGCMIGLRGKEIEI